MINNTIVEYISTERARGVRDEDIRAALLASKWAEADVNEAFGLPTTASVPEVPHVAPAFSSDYMKSLFSGRIGRWHYFFGGLVLGLVACAAIIASIFLVGFSSGFFGLRSDWGAYLVVGLLCFIVVMIPLFIVSVGMSIRRFHDLGKSGWWFLLSFIPYVSVGVSIYLIFFKGEQSANRFGPPEVYSRSIRGAWNSIWRK